MDYVDCPADSSRELCHNRLGPTAIHSNNNNNNNNNKRQFVRRRNMSVDITRAPYRQSGNVVRDSSTETRLHKPTETVVWSDEYRRRLAELNIDRVVTTRKRYGVYRHRTGLMRHGNSVSISSQENRYRGIRTDERSIVITQSTSGAVGPGCICNLVFGLNLHDGRLYAVDAFIYIYIVYLIKTSKFTYDG